MRESESTPEGMTKTAGDLGARGVLGQRRRNMFRLFVIWSVAFVSARLLVEAFGGIPNAVNGSLGSVIFTIVGAVAFSIGIEVLWEHYRRRSSR